MKKRKETATLLQLCDEIRVTVKLDKKHRENNLCLIFVDVVSN